MAAKKDGTSGLATLINAAGFLLAAILVMHIIFVLIKFPQETGIVQSVGQAAVPLALFFPGLIDAPNPPLQVLSDFGLAAMFWMLLTSLFARIFG